MKPHNQNRAIRSQAEQQHLNKFKQSESVHTGHSQTQTAVAEARLEAHLQASLRPHGARHLWMQLRP
jgi:hypothetical protein